MSPVPPLHVLLFLNSAAPPDRHGGDRILYRTLPRRQVRGGQGVRWLTAMYVAFCFLITVHSWNPSDGRRHCGGNRLGSRAPTARQYR